MDAGAGSGGAVVPDELRCVPSLRPLLSATLPALRCHRIRHIEYVRPVDIFREPNLFDIYTEPFSKLDTFQMVIETGVMISQSP